MLDYVCMFVRVCVRSCAWIGMSAYATYRETHTYEDTFTQETNKRVTLSSAGTLYLIYTGPHIHTKGRGCE